MFATIKLLRFGEDIRINANPIQEISNYKVYELVNSRFPNDITKTVNGHYSGRFRHIALDSDGNGYLFDIERSKLAGHIGECCYIAD